MGHEYKYKCARCGKPLKYEYAGGLCRSCATPTWKCRECGRGGNVVDDADDDVDANVGNGLFGIYDCGIVHASN